MTLERILPVAAILVFAALVAGQSLLTDSLQCTSTITKQDRYQVGKGSE